MSRYFEIKLKAYLNRDNILADFEKVKKSLAILLYAFVVSLIVALVVGFIPNKILGRDLQPFASTLIDKVKALRWLIIVAIVGALFFRNTRETINNIVLNDTDKKRKKQAILLLLISVFLITLSLYPSKYGIPARSALLATVADICLILSGIIAIVLYRQKHYLPLKNEVLQSDDLLKEEESLSEDQKAILDDLCLLIGQEQKIRSIGLFGAWGTGKTTIYNLCKKSLKDREDILWLDFKPWKYTSQESLVLGFFGEIGQLIETKLPGKQNSLARLLDASESLVNKNDKVGFFTTLSNYFKKSLDGREKPGEYIENILENAGKRLIVSIDDAERGFDKAQINRSLQLVHELNRTRVSYIFIADKEALLDCMPKRIDVTRRNEYLEKFIEQEVHVPTPSQADLRTYLNQLLSKSENNIPEDFNLNIRNSVIEDIHSYRGVLKIFNKFIWQLDKRFYDK